MKKQMMANLILMIVLTCSLLSSCGIFSKETDDEKTVEVNAGVAENINNGTNDSKKESVAEQTDVEPLIPAMQTGCETHYAEGEERDRIFRLLENISINIKIDENGIVREEK